MRNWSMLAVAGLVATVACVACAQDTKPASTQPAAVKIAADGTIAFKDIMAMPEKGQNKMEDGLIIEDIIVGTGASPTATSTVVCHYTGWLTDGTKFDSSRDRGQPLSFGLYQVI